jgi:hypothetical protein
MEIMLIVDIEIESCIQIHSDNLKILNCTDKCDNLQN